MKMSLKSTSAIGAGDGKAMLAGLLLCAMVAVMSIAYGFQYRADAERPLSYFLGFSALYFLCLAALCVVAARPVPLPGAGATLPARLGLAMTTGSVVLTLYFTSGQLPVPVLASIGVTVVAVAGVAATLGTTRALWLALVLGLAVQIALALGNPLDVAAANMLPVIEAGCGKLLNGENPHLAEYPGITSVALIYLPGLLLPYCGPVALGLDVRILNVALLAAIIAYAAWAFDFRNRPERLSLGLLPLLLSPVAAQMMVHGHVWSYWLLVVIFVHTLATRRYLAAAVVLGLMLATRQMAVFLAIPAAIYMSTRLGVPALLRYGAISIATFLVVMAPVMLTVPDWVYFFFLSTTQIGEQSHLTYGNPMNQVSLSGLLTDSGMAGLLRPLQAGLLLLAGAAFWLWRRRLGFEQALFLLGVTYVLVIGLNSFLHRYFYVPGLILLATGIAYSLAGQRDRGIAAGPSGPTPGGGTRSRG